MSLPARSSPITALTDRPEPNRAKPSQTEPEILWTPIENTSCPGSFDNHKQAALEQVAFWFLNRDKLGLICNRPNLGTYQQFAQLDLLPSVKTVLKTYERWMV